MIDTKHTPGPWKATKDPHGASGDYCIGMATDVARIDRVAVCSERDARLIAAAPEMLEALQRLSAQCTRLRLPGQPETDAEKTARAVIAKATGGAA